MTRRFQLALGVLLLGLSACGTDPISPGSQQVGQVCYGNVDCASGLTCTQDRICVPAAQPPQANNSANNTQNSANNANNTTQNNANNTQNNANNTVLNNNFGPNDAPNNVIANNDTPNNNNFDPNAEPNNNFGPNVEPSCEPGLRYCESERNYIECVFTDEGEAVEVRRRCPDLTVCEDGQCIERCIDRDGDGTFRNCEPFDCDDNNPEIFPGAKDVPGNGIDEDCSGKDAPLPSFEDHPSRKIVKRALDAANNAAIKKAEQIPDPPKNVVVILIDTLRADHMGFMGYERKTSPNIDALAAESIIFEDAYATAPHTPRSIPCLFFGRYPSHIKWRGGQYNYPKVRPENLSMFEVLQENGWKNYGFSSHFYFQEKRGMWQGFEAWDNEGAGTIAESNEDIASPRTWAKTEPKLAELAAASKKEGAAPFGVFLHLFEPHSRWIGHDEYDFGKGDTPAERHINNYDSEIAYVDAYVGKVVAKLKALGIYDDTVIILTSDHGEAFQDHGLFFHGQNLYDEVIKVPLLIRVPGWKPRRVEGPISLVDVAPTYLDLMDISVPQDFEGQSLVATMLGKAPVPDRPIFSELLPYTNWKEHHKVIIQGNLKYIRVLTSNTQQLYDLSKDPKEKNDLSRTNKEDVEKMRAKLDAWMSGG